MTLIKKIEPSTKTITLCGTFGCCPTVEFKDKKILIKDDFGGKVILNKDQWNDLVKKGKKIK